MLTLVGFLAWRENPEMQGLCGYSRYPVAVFDSTGFLHMLTSISDGSMRHFTLLSKSSYAPSTRSCVTKSFPCHKFGFVNHRLRYCLGAKVSC